MEKDYLQEYEERGKKRKLELENTIQSLSNLLDENPAEFYKKVSRETGARYSELFRDLEDKNYNIPGFEELAKKVLENKPDNQICHVCGGATLEPYQKILSGYASDGRTKVNRLGLYWEYYGLHECPVCNKKKADILLKENFVQWVKDAGVSPRHASAKISDFPASYKKLIKDEKGLYLFGPRGTGKTHLMAALAKEFIKDGGPFVTGHGEVVYECETPLLVSVPDLLMELRACFRQSSTTTEGEVLEKYINAGVLLLDDIGAEKVTEWVEQSLYILVDNRYRNMSKTIISSNLSLGELSNRVGDRIASRIAEMCKIVKIGGKDRRLK